MMRQIDKTLVEQMQISSFEVEHRKKMLDFDASDVEYLNSARSLIQENVDRIVDDFYNAQIGIPAIAVTIGDADTLARLRLAQKRYILDIFSGFYDEEYVNNRLRIGMVHKRIGVEPKLYLSAIRLLMEFIKKTVRESELDRNQTANVLTALEKIMFFDITLVFETYIRSMLLEVQIEKSKSVEYANNLEQLVRDRTKQLDELSRTDPLTGLLNRRYLSEDLTRAVRAAERRGESISVAYFDIDDFKELNDKLGHSHGDNVLEVLGKVIMETARAEDSAYRYGGDEFCVVLPACSAEEAAEKFCARVIDEMRQRLEGIGLSVGIAAMGPTHYGDAAELLIEADRKMYDEKKSRKRTRKGSAAPPESTFDDTTSFRKRGSVEFR